MSRAVNTRRSSNWESAYQGKTPEISSNWQSKRVIERDESGTDLSDGKMMLFYGAVIFGIISYVYYLNQETIIGLFTGKTHKANHTSEAGL